MRSARWVSILFVVVLAGLAAVWIVQKNRPARPTLEPPSVVDGDLATTGNADSSAQDAGPADSAGTSAQPQPKLEILPNQLELAGPGDGCQIVVTRKFPDGTTEDLTRACEFAVVPDDVVEVARSGYVRALAAGTVAVTAYADGADATASFTVNPGVLPVSDFALDVVPILTKSGCNSGQCHGSAQGKGGFQLSLFGYDPESDHSAFTRSLEGRRVDPFDPDASLALLKPSLALPHGGGARLRAGSADYERVRRWVVDGTPWRDESRGQLERIVVSPDDLFLATAPAEQQLQVAAEYADGTRRDVTRLCLFVSNDPATIAASKSGLVRMLRRGQADVVVRYANRVATVRLAAPFNDATDFEFAALPKPNFIDERVAGRLEHMRLPVSPRTSDEEFLRRIWFDLVGHMPDPAVRQESDVIESFLADSDPDKRDKMIDKLLKHPDFVLFWAIKFGDLLQINSQTTGTATGGYKIWLRNQLSVDKQGHSASYDKIVRDLLLAKGSLRGARTDAPQTTYYAAPREPGEIAEQVARRFLGIRIRCARCHDHPLDVWTQDDYYGFASFFGGVRVEAGSEPLAQEVKVVPENAVRHLRTNETPKPKLLAGATPNVEGRDDVRELLVDWMFDPDNPRFSRMSANWVWAHLMGRGLVEPVDDLRETNPPTNRELLDDLARSFRESGYDLRSLIRTICRSETYQRTSTPIAGNESDEKFFSHALIKPLTAHQMADAIAQVTGVPNGYGMDKAKTTRSIELNDVTTDYLLDILGRCDRSGGCEVGSLVRPASLKLALHLIIGDAINSKFERQGSKIGEMASYYREVEPARRAEVQAAQIESIYMRAYGRRPTAEETEYWQQTLVESDDYAAALEDMLWAVLNSREFVVNH